MVQYPIQECLSAELKGYTSMLELSAMPGSSACSWYYFRPPLFCIRTTARNSFALPRPPAHMAYRIPCITYLYGHVQIFTFLSLIPPPPNIPGNRANTATDALRHVARKGIYKPGVRMAGQAGTRFQPSRCSIHFPQSKKLPQSKCLHWDLSERSTDFPLSDVSCPSFSHLVILLSCA